MSATAAPVRDRLPLTGLLLGHGTSTAGNAITLVAVPLHVLQTTGSAALTGLAGFCATAPVVLGGTLGGVVADRIGHRRASVVADLASAAAIGLAPLLHVSVGLPLWALLTLVALAGALDVPGQSSRYALLPPLAALARTPLERATAVMSGSERGAAMLGAPLGGLLVVWLGGPAALAVDAATFLLSAALVARCVPPAARGESDEEPASYRRDLREGLQLVLRQPLLRGLILMIFITNVLDVALLSVLLPVHSARVLGDPAAFGLLLGVFGGGALAGCLLWGALGPRLPRRAAFVAGFLLAGSPPFAALALELSLPRLLVVFALAGLAAGSLNPIIDAVLLERTPEQARARVMGLVSALTWVGTPTGPLLAGVAVEGIGLGAALIVAGGAYLLVTLAPLRGGPWRELGRRAPADVGERQPAPRGG
ncbi:MFS transporter [Kineococcus xinjiangensis]|uniref:MFS transporter n=1 Tax=Kineococcus xinjiangensis TaxID=512762 RepID=A0A2S6II30_9ACTN|nr:MFS transporter [Kineococcus xinjiangensis]PPK93830.1 MFS transporter [Kineococcus xinjiangensis]